jgi:hypothetical protein
MLYPFGIFGIELEENGRKEKIWSDNGPIKVVILRD